MNTRLHGTDRPRLLYITSVGTGIGKTLVTAILCHQLTRVGRAVRPSSRWFPASRPTIRPAIPALILRSLGQSPTPQSIAAIAPWRFAAPLSPHLAARREGRTIRIDDVAAFCREQAAQTDGLLLIEGAGGVMAPIDDAHTGLDLIARLGHPVILVTGSYLGAISHTLTALRRARGAEIVVRGSSSPNRTRAWDLPIRSKALLNLPDDDAPVCALPRLAWKRRIEMARRTILV